MELLENTYLAKAILTRCLRIDLYAKEIVETERDTKRFMAEYCEQLEPYLETLRTLDKELRRLQASASTLRKVAAAAPNPITMPIAAHNSSRPRTRKEAHSLTGELRKLYRTLAKDFHPDIQSIDDDTIKQLNDAHSHQRLGSLWQIAFSSAWKQPSDEVESDRTVMLRFYEKKTKHALHVVQSHLLQLQGSTDFLLKERSFLATLKGHSFTADIIESLEEEITTKQRRLTYLELTAPMREYRKTLRACSE